MKTRILILTICLLLPAISLIGQVEYMRLSPAQKIEQRVGATDLAINFSRPQMKGRTIFGDLVPFDRLWRTGANENTVVSFDHRIKVGSSEVPAGSYALFTKPGTDEWEIYFYTETDNLDVPDPIDSSKLLYLTTVPVHTIPKEETLVINFYDISENAASLGVSWENSAVRIPITFFSREAMEKKIEKEFKQNVFDYSITASYYLQRGIELEKAKELQELAIDLKGKANAWDLHTYGLILLKLGETERALKNLEESLARSRESKNDYLISENITAIKSIGQ